MEMRGEARDRAAVALRGVSKSYGEHMALHAIDLEIREGEFFCLLGPSGCGKTTTLNLIGGFVVPTSGEVYIRGERVDRLPPHQRKANTVFQSYALFPHMTVERNVAFGLEMSGVAKEERRERVARALEMVGLAELKGRRPGELSGGQQQRVAVARALVNRPAVLLLDEPLGALDLKLRRRLQVELAQLQRELGTTFVYVTHDQEEAMSMADRIAVMNEGRIEQLGTPEEIYNRPCSEFVAQFIGESNIFDAAVLPGQLRGESVQGKLLIRPEAMQISTNGSGPGHALRAVVVETAFLGGHTRVVVDCDACEPHLHVALSNREAATHGLEAGTEVALWWDHTDAVALKARSSNETTTPEGRE